MTNQQTNQYLPGNRMLLNPHRVTLQRHQHHVAQPKNDVQFQSVLSVERKLIGAESGVVRVAVDQPDVVVDIVGGARVVVVPFAGGGVVIARHHGYVPKSRGE